MAKKSMEQVEQQQLSHEQIQEGDREKRVAAIKRLFQDGINWTLAGDEVIDKDVRDYVLGRAEVDLEQILSDPSEIDAFLAVLEQIPFTNKESFIDSFTDTLARLLTERFSSLEALEERMRRVTVDTEGMTEVNELLYYELSGPGDLKLHISAQFAATPLRIYTLMRQGFRSLAQKLAHDPSLAQITRIYGTTWIAFKNHELAERLGFTITKRDEKERVATVEMTRTAFLERYGNN